MTTEYLTKVFTLHPDNYDADATALSSWLSRRAAEGWRISAMTNEIQATGRIVSLVLAMRDVQQPVQQPVPNPAIDSQQHPAAAIAPSGLLIASRGSGFLSRLGDILRPWRLLAPPRSGSYRIVAAHSGAEVAEARSFRPYYRPPLA